MDEDSYSSGRVNFPQILGKASDLTVRYLNNIRQRRYLIG
jgi:hypothetical protein